MRTINKELFRSTSLKLVLFLFLGICTSVLIKAQSSFTINTGGSSDIFSPDILTINPGDTVNWINIGGFHNVNGSLATYPGNPEGFDNGSANNSAWTFFHVFTLPGTYDYQCDPHAPGMSGIITVNSTVCPPSFSYTTVDATDAFTNDGEITITVDPLAIGPFDYYLFDISGSIIQGPIMSQNSNIFTFSNLLSGYYEVAVNNQECSSAGFNSEDSIYVYSISGGTITYSGFMGYCGPTGAEITAFSNGCSSPILLGNEFLLNDITGTYVWDSITMLDSAALPTLVAGTYILQITNQDNNCICIDTFTINSSVIQSTFSTSNVTSTVATDGYLVVNAVGTAPYQMWFDNGSGFSQIPGWLNGDTINNLGVGNYIYWIIDDLGCQTQNVFTIQYNSCTSTLIQPISCDPTVVLSAQTTNSISGTYNFTYNLYFEGTLIEVFGSSLDSIGFTNAVSDSGQYVLEVVNNTTGCMSSDSLVLNLNTMSINVLAQTNISTLGACDGFLSVEVLGGSFPYSITWTDSLGSIVSGPSSPFNTSSIASLCENTYCITVTDGTPCTITECYDIIFESCITTFSITDSIDCFGGIGEISITVDTLPVPVGPIPFVNRYTYTLYSMSPQTQIGAVQSTNNLTMNYPNLLSGMYMIMVFDSSYGTYCHSDSLFLPEPAIIDIYLTVDSTSAPWIEDGVITIDSITGGTQPYIITWLDSAGNPLPTSGILVQDSLGYSNQYNGGYTIIVDDTNGCTNQITVYIHPKNSGDSLAIDSVGVENASCFGLCDGKMYMRPLNIGPGSVAPFTYIWRDNAGNILKVDSLGSVWYNPSHVATYVNRCAGFYTLEIFDYYGNSLPVIDFTVSQPDSMYVNLGPDIVIDCGEDTVLTAVPVGGNLTNDTTLVNSFVLDFNNPSGIGDTLVTGGLYLLVVNGTLTDTSGNIYDAAYDYTALPPTEVMLWDFDGTNTHRPSPNIYQTTHSYNFPFFGGNSGGIQGMGIHTWSVPSSNYSGQLTFNLYIIDTSITNYNYSWTSIPPSFPNFIISDEDTCYTYPGITPTDYIVEVTDTKGCIAIDTVNVMWDLYILNVNQINLTNVVPCYGNNSGTINVSVDSSTGFTPYSYYVEDSLGTNINYSTVTDTTFNLIAGDYTIYLEDSLGCLSNNSIVTITQPDSIWACGVGNLNAQFLIDNFVMDFDTISNTFNHTSAIPTLLGVNYLLVVNGTYGTDFFNPNHKDAAFIISSGVATDDWSLNGLPIRPDIDIYNPTHQYSYTFTGDGNSTTFAFIDPNGTYNDNAGSLIFTLYKSGCLDTDTAYTCVGDSTAYSDIDAYGGVPFDPDGISNSGDEYYNYEWTNAAGTIYSTSSSVSGLPAGDYTVKIIDANGCDEYERYLKVLEAPNTFQIDSTEVHDVLCFGDTTAHVKAYLSGGFGPYLAVLTHINGGTVDTIYTEIGMLDSVVVDSLIYGSYVLYVYDSVPSNLYGEYFCPQIFTFNINQPQTPMSSTINLLTHVSCWGDSTGKASIVVAGGQSQLPYTYLWDNGETTAIADSLWADENTVYPSSLWQGITVTDSNGCTLRDSIQIEHLNYEIQAYNTLDGTNTVQVIQNVQCFNACDAIATVSSVGGVLPHNYSWDIGQVGNFMPDTATGLCFGGHDIIIEDQVGCRKTVEYQISQPDELFANASLVDYWSYNGVNSPTGNVQCFGFDNGSAHAFATGGTLGYTFVWDSLTGQMNDTAGVMNGPNFGLTPGIHTVYVIDENGCMASDTVMVTEPDQLTVVIQDSSTVYSYCTGTNSAELCAIAFGGIPNYTYVWNDILGQTTPCAHDLAAGIYEILVIDERGCIASDITDIDSVTNSMDASTAVTNVSCFGLFDGSTYVDNVWGAVAPYTYSWTGPNGYTANQNQINFLYYGNYGVTITDSNNCSITIYTDVIQPDQLEYTLYDVIGATCFGACNGSISVDVQGGTAPYSYDGDQLGNFAFTNPVSLVNDSLILDLCAGDYDIYITDDNDCIGTVLWSGAWQATIDSGVVVDVVGVNVTQPATCYNTNDGHANVMFPVNPMFTYTWETVGGTLVDTGAFTTILSGGNYNLVAHYSDSANFGQVYTGCDATVPFVMTSPAQILPNEVITPISCYGNTTANGLADGIITLNVTGGSGVYTYEWDITTSTPSGPTTSVISNLQEGTYTVTITDDMGCEETYEFDMVEPSAITNNFSNIVDVSCNGLSDGSVKANPVGGVGSYTYSWSPSGSGQTANGLSANDYTVTITDGNSCSNSFDITIEEPDAIISAVEPNAFYGNDATGAISYHISCNGLSDGAAIVSLGGGTSPFTYSWTTSGSSQLENNMPAGTHSVTVTDDNGCTETMSVTLIEPDLLVVNGSSSGDYNPFPGGFDVSCKGLNDGEIYADPYGGVPGTAGYMYSWTGPINGQISNLDEIVNLYIGSYSVTVTDANGCTDVQSFILTEPTEEFISITHLVNYAGAGIAPLTAGFQDATVSVDPYNYMFYWPTGDSTPVITVSINQIFPDHSFDVIGENEVYITVQNMNSGCIDDTTFIIDVQGIPEIHNVFTPNGDGTNDYFDFSEYAMKSVNVYLYNRWGELVFNWNTLDTQWDGTGLDGEDLPEGVYYYVLNAVGEDGFDYDKKGSITLLR